MGRITESVDVQFSCSSLRITYRLVSGSLLAFIYFMLGQKWPAVRCGPERLGRVLDLRYYFVPPCPQVLYLCVCVCVLPSPIEFS